MRIVYLFVQAVQPVRAGIWYPLIILILLKIDMIMSVFVVVAMSSCGFDGLSHIAVCLMAYGTYKKAWESRCAIDFQVLLNVVASLHSRLSISFFGVFFKSSINLQNYLLR